MADQMTARLMQMMRGERTNQSQLKEPGVSSATAEIVSQARVITGTATPTSTESPDYRARISARVRQLREQGVPYPDVVARRQIEIEDRDAAEQAERRLIHEDMPRLAKAGREREIREAEKKAQRPAEKKPRDPYVVPGAALPETHDSVAHKLYMQYLRSKE